jgi:hypothetical protein
MLEYKTLFTNYHFYHFFQDLHSKVPATANDAHCKCKMTSKLEQHNLEV